MKKSKRTPKFKKLTLIAPLILMTAAILILAKVVADLKKPVTPQKSKAYSELLDNSILPAFPGAQGFGSKTKGGRGGKIIEVTNLYDSGAGSLRAALEADGARIVVFRVGGIIKLNSNLKIERPYVTVAGQTAPGTGIVLRGAGIKIGTHDVIIRGLRVRPGDDAAGEPTTSRDAINISNSGSGQEIYNVIIDHNSISWGIDENTSIYNGGPGIHDVTYSWNIISEGLDRSIHIDEGATTPDRHSMGMGLFSQSGKPAPTNISLHHNYFAHNNDRHPLSRATNVEFVNNLIYNWGAGPTKIDSDLGRAVNFNLVGNHYIAASNTRSDLPKSLPVWIESDVPSGSKIFIDDNIGPANSGGSGDEAWKNVYCQSGCQRTNTPAFSATIPNLLPSTAVKNLVLRYAGANTNRDKIDLLMVDDATYNTGKIADCVVNCDDTDTKVRQGWDAYTTSYAAPSDSDHDGMPNTWETARGLNPNDAADATSLAASGYTYIEEYVNSLIALPNYLIPPAPTPTPSPVAAPVSTTPPVYEAENQTLVSAQVDTNNRGYTGTGFVNFLQDKGSSITWESFQADSAGYHNVKIRYALGGADRSLEMKINGKIAARKLRFSSTGSWTAWQVRQVRVYLRKGDNIFVLSTIGQEGPNIDYISL